MARELTDLLLENFGKTILRKKENHNFTEWIPTTLNDTYLEHILEFPEEYALPFLNYKELEHAAESN